MKRRDLIGIAGSAGALPALISFLDAFQPSAPCSLFVVLHRSVETSHLAGIVDKATSFEVCEPGDGEPIRSSCIYLAPPDCHMMVGHGHLHLKRGPRENNFRPAIDPLFRSLTVFGMGRVCGVVLSGYLDDGASGARAIEASGGIVLVQDPADALSPAMPRAAISAVGEPRAIASASELGKLVGRISGEPAGKDIAADEKIKLEMMIAGLEKASMANENKLGELSPFNCPDCNGVLWEISDGPMTRFRCHTGHAYTAASLDKRQEEMLERSLYDSLRSLREKAEMLRRLAERGGSTTDRLLDRAEGYSQDAETIEQMLLTRYSDAA